MQVFIGRFARIKQVFARVGAKRPVVVLTAAVHAVEGLLAQKAHQAVPRRHLAHHFHGELVVIGGDVGGFKDGRQFVLRGGRLVVLRLGEHAQLPQFLV